MQDWFDPSDDAILDAREQWRRNCRRWFDREELPVSPYLLYANNGKGRLFDAAGSLLDATATIVFDGRANGYVHYRLPSGAELTLYRALDQAPYASSHLDVLISQGARTIIFLNGAGSLRRDIPVGSVILPGELVREEGTSYHYAPADVVLRTSDRLTAHLSATAARLGVPVVSGRHWTTDAILRETVGKVNRLAAAGVISVEMELSALAGVVHFHRAELASVHVVTDVVAKPHTWTGVETAAFEQGAHAAARLAVAAIVDLAGAQPPNAAHRATAP